MIGKSSDGAYLFAAYDKARLDTGTNSSNFFDVYFSYSTNKGVSWTTGAQCTNLPGQGSLADYRYVSISPVNVPAGGLYKSYLLASKDTLPGSNTNTIMKAMFMTVTINPTGIHNISSNIPSHFSLSQNYPNPFNPSTVIKFDIRPPLIPLLGKEGTGVVLKVYSILGKEVASLVNQELSTGAYEVTFDGTNLPSGVYFYKLVVGGNTNNGGSSSGQSFTETKKMVMIK